MTTRRRRVSQHLVPAGAALDGVDDAATATIQHELAAIHRRIEGMAAGTVPSHRRLDALRRQTALVSSAVWASPDEARDRLAQLKTRLALAEHSAAAEASADWETFSAAVVRELDGWDVYLERLQTSIASKPCAARAHAEREIAELRTRRIEVGDRLEQARERANEAWQEERARVMAARDALERTANELSFAERNARCNGR